MQRPLHIVLISSVWLLVGLLRVEAQQIFPGDIDGNGQVEHYDVLYLGYAFNTIGPPRDTLTESDLPQFATWAQSFPNGRNYGAADVNGDGLVNLWDLVTLRRNYGIAWAANPQMVTAVPGVAGLDPMLRFMAPDRDTLQLTAGATVSLPLTLGSATTPLNELNGIAFKVRFNPRHLSAVRLNLGSQDSWLAANDDGAFSEQITFQHISPGVIEVAFTRLGQSGITGRGIIGELSFIIIEDMIDLLPNPTDSLLSEIVLEEVMAIDSRFEPIPITLVSLPMYLHPKTTATAEPIPPGSVQVFPNPTAGQLAISSELPFVRLDLYDVLGRRYPLYSGPPLRQYRWEQPLPRGMYYLHVWTTDQRTGLYPIQIINQ